MLNRTLFFSGLGLALVSSSAIGQQAPRTPSSTASTSGGMTQNIPIGDWRCGTPPSVGFPTGLVAPSDCGFSNTVINPQYNPGTVHTIPVVFHVIQQTNGNGFISQAQVQSQVQILNEDFGALAGSNGAPGTDSAIRFELASTDPNGNPTNGITYSTNNTWFNDGGGYYNSLAWDPHNYLNIYTNNGGGALGYVPNIPQGGIVGQALDRIVLLWSTVGNNAPIGPPFHLGRTATHEVGHYLGLEHTFNGGCGGASCYNSGDLLCDTNPESTPTNGCPGNKVTCGSPDPIHNYMDYSNDNCMWEFTPEQINRMRCTLEEWRPNLADSSGPPPPPPTGDAVKLNIDIGSNSSFPPPGSNYGGAAGQTGVWNGIPGNANNAALLATDGSASGVTATVAGGNGSFQFNSTQTTGNPERLLDDLQDAGNSTWAFNGVPNGTYDVYLYSWAPDDPTGFTSQLTVVGGTGPQVCGGANWGGNWVSGQHYVADTVTVANNSIVVQIAQIGGAPASLNAVQIVGHDNGGGGGSGSAYCLGDGTGASCPCANGGSGSGCANTTFQGATLTGTGNAEFGNDSFGLQVSGMPAGKAGLAIKGSSVLGGGNGSLLGDGLLCTNAQIRSQVIVSNGTGSVTMTNWKGGPFSSWPGAANFGVTTYYQWWYRNPESNCSGSGFNLSNGWQVNWQ